MARPPDKPLVIEPAPAAWRDLLARSRPDGRAIRFREQLGLPTDRPIIMSGHQAAIWHPGILAKYLAAGAAARAFGAHAVWLIVDQDAHDFWSIPAPVRDSSGRLSIARIGLEPIASEHKHTLHALISAALPPLRCLPSGGLAFASGAVSAGVEQIAGALVRHETRPSAAAQLSAAAADLATRLAAPPRFISATDLARTDLFAELVRQMRLEAHRCVAAYNTAAARHVAAGVRPLQHGADRCELPAWQIKHGVRTPVFSDRGLALPMDQFAPRALLMTGLLRLAGCDLFIHGTGGGDLGADRGYDRVTEEWFRDWLAEALAPTATVTATLRLPLDAAGVPLPEEIARAKWLAHTARHQPALLGDPAAAERKRRLLSEIEQAKQSGSNPASLFAEMHDLLERTRDAHGADLERLDADADHAAQYSDEANIRADRTWPFPLYPEDDLRSLAEQVAAAFPPQVGR